MGRTITWPLVALLVAGTVAAIRFAKQLVPPDRRDGRDYHDRPDRIDERVRYHEVPPRRRRGPVLAAAIAGWERGHPNTNPPGPRAPGESVQILDDIDESVQILAETYEETYTAAISITIAEP
jgi:hypothetical protein